MILDRSFSLGYLLSQCGDYRLLVPDDWQLEPDLSFRGASEDSRSVEPGFLFIAHKGFSHDGLLFAGDALARGATAVLSDHLADCQLLTEQLGIPCIVCENTRRVISSLASSLLHEQRKSPLSIGITGTNGKTSVSWLLASSLSRLVGPTLYGGTLGFKLFCDGSIVSSAESSHTTPDPVSLHKALEWGAKHGAEAEVLEVSSHALSQYRTSALNFRLGMITNITRDHLDYHPNFNQYIAAKNLMFTRELDRGLVRPALAVGNLDDEITLKLLAESCSRLKAMGFGVLNSHDEVAPKLRQLEELGLAGTYCLVRNQSSFSGLDIDVYFNSVLTSFSSRLIGRYNASNLAAALAALLALGYELESAVGALSCAPAVPGRLEVVFAEPFAGLVDYAHTPDALERVLESVRAMCSGRVITVFGCGGDRDRGKRPLMGSVAARLSDIVIITSDNPRSEDPMVIIDEIRSGIDESSASATSVHYDKSREQAIELGFREAQPGDVLLVAGKGHENYQEILGVKLPFSDQDILRRLVETKRASEK